MKIIVYTGGQLGALIMCLRRARVLGLLKVQAKDCAAGDTTELWCGVVDVGLLHQALVCREDQVGVLYYICVLFIILILLKICDFFVEDVVFIPGFVFCYMLLGTSDSKSKWHVFSLFTLLPSITS